MNNLAPMKIVVGSQGNLIAYLDAMLYSYEENTVQANILPFYTPTIPVWGQKAKTFFW